MATKKMTDFLLRALWVVAYGVLIRVFILARKLETAGKQQQ
jgi:hypothetical protein